MKWEALLAEFAGRPLFHSSMLNIFSENPLHVQVQLARWVKAGKLSKIRREWYLIEKPFRSKEVPIPVIATTVVHPSYLSLEWALQYYEMIPEYVPNPTCVTTDRAVQFIAQSRLFIYYHIQSSLFTGYSHAEWEGQKILIAHPEKALLDKLYIFLRKNKFSIEWLQELRLQNLDRFKIDRFKSTSKKINLKGFQRAIEAAVQYIKEEMT
jgi:hypothetical protein